MPENKPAIGLTWEPKLPSLPSSRTSKPSTSQLATPSFIRPNTELIDGLFVPPNDPKKLNKLKRLQRKDTAGANWFDMPAPTITPEIKKDLQLIKLRGVLDPKRHYKKGDSKSKTLPKYFQVGTVIESSTDFYSGRLTKKERKRTIADELLADRTLGQYRKRKVQEIEAPKQNVGNDKWKIKPKCPECRLPKRTTPACTKFLVPVQPTATANPEFWVPIWPTAASFTECSLPTTTVHPECWPSTETTKQFCQEAGEQKN